MLMIVDELLVELDAYFRLLWIYTGIITAMPVLLTALFFINRHARGKHRQTLEYSRHIRNAQEEERAIIARELHDSVIAELRRISFLAYGREEPALLADRINTECGALIRRVREICQSLIPQDFNRLGLLLSLENLCVSFKERNKTDCRLVAPPDLEQFPFPPESKFHCFRIVQEALTNVEKHAGATEVSVLIRREDTALIVLVSDNGRGFNPEPDNAVLPGLGIMGMRDRAAIIGGSFEIRSEPGAGTLVLLQITPPPPDEGNRP
jgi:signal transduction histidine kinase